MFALVCVVLRRFTSNCVTRTIITEAVEKYGTLNDFIGHAGSNDFLLVTRPELAGNLCREITRRFADEAQVFYPFTARQEGKVVYTDGRGNVKESPFMSLSVAALPGTDGPFADIREITEVAADIRRRKPGCPA